MIPGGSFACDPAPVGGGRAGKVKAFRSWEGLSHLRKIFRPERQLPGHGELVHEKIDGGDKVS